ncbi:unnamed protein product [Chilo suppressalis]|uniref:Alpha-1,6-mannosyl-glycoprotein 2-beta-N-acetylglucosaminyltransferase n=1 Tax=Chilo suppressalis TaxID=168631 RepID=A0ABN8BBM9_CHISP|nr:unnamed protein product [Chilo suppressalis]
MGKRVERILKKLRNTFLVLILLFLLIVYQSKKMHNQRVAMQIPNNALKYILFEKSKGRPKDIIQLRTIVSHHNKKINILNSDNFGPITNNTIVFAITVDKFSINLQFLIVSLSQIRGIHQVLLVFSHSIYDEDINKLIGTIDFCRVLQIYYPYSLQMYPDEFPGYSLQDCPHDMDMKTARAINCTGFLFPDIRGHFRDPKHVQQKQHWWWTANVVFESVLSIVMDYERVVVFLNDDIYLLKDFLYMILFMEKISNDLGTCEFLTLDHRNLNFLRSIDGLELTPWDLNYEPSALAFDFNVWNSIVSNYDLFCAVDDSSWTRSLIYVSDKRKKASRFRILSSMFPRTYKINSCMFERTLEYCDIKENVYQILELQKNLNDFLFPTHLELYIPIQDEDDPLVNDDVVGFGGWSDPRDKDMCDNITLSKIKKIVLGMRNEIAQF